MDTSPPSVSGDFGFHNERWLVKLCLLCAENWHWTVRETLNQPLEMIWDMLREHNIKDAVKTGRDQHQLETVEETLDFLETQDPDFLDSERYDVAPVIRF